MDKRERIIVVILGVVLVVFGFRYYREANFIKRNYNYQNMDDFFNYSNQLESYMADDSHINRELIDYIYKKVDYFLVNKEVTGTKVEPKGLEDSIIKMNKLVNNVNSHRIEDEEMKTSIKKLVSEYGNLLSKAKVVNDDELLIEFDNDTAERIKEITDELERVLEEI